jgi:hypothetical protein
LDPVLIFYCHTVAFFRSISVEFSKILCNAKQGSDHLTVG